MIPRERHGIFVGWPSAAGKGRGEERKVGLKPRGIVGPTAPGKGEGCECEHATEIESRPPRPSFSSTQSNTPTQPQITELTIYLIAAPGIWLMVHRASVPSCLPCFSNTFKFFRRCLYTPCHFLKKVYTMILKLIQWLLQCNIEELVKRSFANQYLFQYTMYMIYHDLAVRIKQEILLISCVNYVFFNPNPTYYK